MGSIKKLLSKTKLPDRELHHSRTFVDLAENIHIHFREYRFVFNLNEFFEFLQTLKKSESDVINYLSSFLLFQTCLILYYNDRNSNQTKVRMSS